MTGYAPLDVPKPVADGLWIIDGPPVACRGLPHPTRATVVQLEGGALWVHSPTRLTEDLARSLEALGPVAHLVAPNRLHYTHLPEWQARYPQAQSWGAPGVVQRAARQGVELRIDAGLVDVADLPWRSEIDHLLVGGSARHGEVVFFHRASDTLILTDIIQSFETAHVPVWMRPLIWLSGADDSDGRMPSLLRWSYRDKTALAASVDAMIGWGPARIVLSHGRWYPRDAVGELERAFRRELRHRRWDRLLDEAKRDGEEV